VTARWGESAGLLPPRRSMQKYNRLVSGAQHAPSTKFKQSKNKVWCGPLLSPSLSETASTDK
jgi:hypothetical protein